MNYIRMQIGFLTVLKDSGLRTKDQKRIYVCRCECGKEVEKSSARLLESIRKGRKPSCGCIKKDLHENARDYAGQKIGLLLVLYPLKGRAAGRHVRWACQCDCGNSTVKDSWYLKDSPNPNCGCWNKEIHDRAMLWHGMSETVEHHTWRHIIDRCYNPRNKQYRNYGGRGVSVCDRWKTSFAAFYEDMRDKPHPDLTIERIDNNGNYEPENCKWATRTEQARNTRRNRYITIGGETKCLSEWSRILGISRHTLGNRFANGGGA